MEQSVQRNENLLSLNDLASLMEDMPDFTREQVLHSISETIVNFMEPIRSRTMEPFEEPEPHSGLSGVGARVPQPYCSSGGMREDFRVGVFGDDHQVSQPSCVIGDTQRDCHVKVCLKILQKF
jgi:hypothetical protein